MLCCCFALSCPRGIRPSTQTGKTEGRPYYPKNYYDITIIFLVLDTHIANIALIPIIALITINGSLPIIPITTIIITIMTLTLTMPITHSGAHALLFDMGCPKNTVRGSFLGGVP